MTTATRSVHVDLAPATVFDRIVDQTSLPPGIQVQTLIETSAGVGNVYEWSYRLAGIPLHGVTVYTQYLPPRRLACKNVGLVDASVVFTIAPEDGGAKLTRQMDFTIHIPLVGSRLEALMVTAAQPDAVHTVVCPRLVDFFIRRDAETHVG